MKEEEDMESMKNGVTPQLPWAEGKAWGDSSVAGLGRQTVWVGARGWTAAGEYLGGEGRKEEMRERGEERENRTPGGLDHRESARPSEGREEFRGAVWGARQERELWGQTAASDLPQKDL